MSSANNVFACARSHVCTASLTSSSFANRRPRNTFWSVRKYGNKMARDLDRMLSEGGARISDFESFQESLPPYEFECCHDAKQLHLSGLRIACFNSSSSLAQFCELLNISPRTWYCLRVIPLRSKIASTSLFRQKELFWISWSWALTHFQSTLWRLLAV
jgi:hypothetical protein